MFTSAPSFAQRILPPALASMRLPVIGAPLFIVSTPKLVIAQCKAGIIGSMPALNARPAGQLDDWLAEIRETLDAYDLANPSRPSAPFALNQIVHKGNERLDHDLTVAVKHRVPITISSLGARADVNDAMHACGGVVLHDIITNAHARKAIDKGADGLIAVAVGAGGHGGQKSPFALIAEIRQWFAGPLVLGGAIANGSAVLAAQAMGADLAYVGTAFVATHEARASDEYKQAIVAGNSDDIVGSTYFTGVYGNYLKASIRRAGLDPDNLPCTGGPAASAMNFDSGVAPAAPEGSSPGTAPSSVKAWRDIWGAGQGIGSIDSVVSTSELVARLGREYEAARTRVAALPPYRA